VPEQDLGEVRAELAEARGRIRDLERQLASIVSSPAWARTLQLRAWKKKLTSGPFGSLLSRVIRLVQIVRVEGPSGVVKRAMWRLRSSAAGSAADASGILPPRLSPMAVSPPAGRPGVSIIIPVFNRATVTYQCLQSLLARTEPGSYELIVVNDASRDDTARLLGHVRGLRVITNRVHRGAVDAYNQGAEAARAELLLFLSHDVLPLPGWLPTLASTLERDPSVGAVGAHIRYPDGRLQEAGGIIWRDGSGWSHGRGDDSYRPEYAHLREVDFCSAACLLVRRSLFVELRGFDRRFAPEGYESADLCFRIRQLGYRVVYQPAARVVRLDEPPTGIDPAGGFRRLPEASRNTFVATHATALAAQHPPDPAGAFRARDRRAGKRVLVVDHMVPLYDQDAGSVRMLGLLEILGELGHAVTFVPDNLTPLEPYIDTLRQIGVEVLYGAMSIPDYLEEHLGRFDLVILCRATIAVKYLPAIVARPARPPVVFDTIDLHYLREQRRAEVEDEPEQREEAARTKATELGLARVSDMVWVVSPHEAEVLRQEDPTLRVAVVPLVHRGRETVPPFAGRRDLMFIGGFRHPPNEDAVRFFATEIFPLVKRKIPGVRFLVVGGDVPPAVEALASEDVVIAGYVKDVDPVFDGARVFVAPLRYGAGLKGKITQSFTCGLPVVTTTIGAEGLDLACGVHALIADEPDDFARRVIELYEDGELWTRLSRAAREHVDARFGHAAVKRRLDETLRALWR
jgi:GT2 family glycosyltransferase/glycosyltransferase involved in cell wall biosynthesis